MFFGTSSNLLTTPTGAYLLYPSAPPFLNRVKNNSRQALLLLNTVENASIKEIPPKLHNLDLNPPDDITNLELRLVLHHVFVYDVDSEPKILHVVVHEDVSEDVGVYCDGVDALAESR